MTQSPLIHPRMLLSLRRHFNSLATLLNPTTAYDDHNEPIETFTPDTILANIRCYIEPVSSATSGEERQPGNTLVSNLFNVMLMGFYPQITNAGHVSINGKEYNIKDVASDDTNTMTVLVVEVVTL